MIVVTGASGQLGSRIASNLLQSVPAEQLALSVRDPQKAQAFSDRGIRVRAASFNEPESLDHAFEGAQRVLIVSAGIRDHTAAIAANTAAIAAAVRSGASRVVYTSHQAASKQSLFAAQRVHASSEEHLAASGIAFTSLRNGFYANAIVLFLAEARTSRTISLPADGQVSWTHHDDLAEAAAIAATTDGVLGGVTPPLTAPELLDFAGIAEIAGEALGYTVARVVMDDAAWVQSAVEHGMAAPDAQFVLGMFRAARAGEFAVIDPTLESILARPAAPARRTIEKALSR